MNNQADRNFIDDIKKQLQQAEDNTDGSTQSALTKARHAALESNTEKRTKNWKLPAFATASFVSLLISFAVFINFDNNHVYDTYLMSEYEYSAYIDSTDPIFGYSENINGNMDEELYLWFDELEQS